jgi:hypothetical protein
MHDLLDLRPPKGGTPTTALKTNKTKPRDIRDKLGGSKDVAQRKKIAQVYFCYIVEFHPSIDVFALGMA